MQGRINKKRMLEEMGTGRRTRKRNGKRQERFSRKARIVKSMVGICHNILRGAIEGVRRQ